ncbi:MAG TPA: YbhB/YbcL family Raf kinase inhibitor-like protein [Chlorobaculum sp.]|nr:YbhB/YbcL family Raf kinase inhibitor-like protein [Chlorobaculum sp.]
MKCSTILKAFATVAATAMLIPATVNLQAEQKGGETKLALSSPAFRHMESIPTVFTCDGRNVSPPLAWSHVPPGTKSLVLIVDDPDAPDPAAPKITWVHWLLYNIPTSMDRLAEGAGNRAPLKPLMDGTGSSKKTGYGGPCPPIGTHRYFHKLYALDVVLPDLSLPDKTALEAAMKGHILGEAVLIGTYRKTKP